MIETGGDMSPDGLYRYRLWRRWGPGEDVVWIMLNPSTADATTDDRTISRCISFSQGWGFGGMEVVNLYALRATDPKELVGHPDPEGPDNARAWQAAGCFEGDRTVVAAWGGHVDMSGLRRSRVLSGRSMAGFKCLGTTEKGHPRHPLYVKNGTAPISFR